MGVKPTEAQEPSIRQYHIGQRTHWRPGNERADRLAGEAAERQGRYGTLSLAHLKLRISERFRTAKEEWNSNPAHHGSMEIPPPPPKKSMLDKATNAIAQTASQIRTGHWRSAVYLKRIRKRTDDGCWFCRGARAWEGKSPGGVRVLLANPRWERRFVKLLELTGVGRTVADGTSEDGARAARMDEWVAWETGGEEARGVG